MEVAKETKFGTKVAQRRRMMPELRIRAQHRESVRYHTKDNRRNIIECLDAMHPVWATWSFLVSENCSSLLKYWFYLMILLLAIMHYSDTCHLTFVSLAKYSASTGSDFEALYIQTLEFITTCNGEHVRCATDMCECIWNIFVVRLVFEWVFLSV